MPAVVTDQFRISNASNFIDSVLDSNNSYYVFLGLANPTKDSPQGPIGFGRTDEWNIATRTPSPVDNFQYSWHYRDTSLFGKKITSANIRRVIKKYSWVANSRYDMYRHDYQVGINTAPNGQTGSLYKTNYYVINSDYRVYICIENGSSGTNPKGNRSLDEPTFTDLEPTAAGSQGDGYIWKYLFTVSPSDIVKFDSTEYIVVPNDWGTTTDNQIQSIRESGDSQSNNNQIKTVYIENAGSSLSSSYREGDHTCSILGDGSGGKCLVTVDTNGKIISTKVIAGGTGYTYGIVDLKVAQLSDSIAQVNLAKLIPIIPPSRGHGYDIYSELGTDKVLIYARFDDSTKDFPADTKFSQVGVIKNPSQSSSSVIFTENQFTSLSSMKISGDGISVTDSLIGVGITQSTSDNKVARGYIASYDKDTKVLKYFQDRSLFFSNAVDQTDNPYVNTNSEVVKFESSKKDVIGISPSFNVGIDTSFSGVTTTLGTKQINLGVNFSQGLADSQINKKTGDIIYIDNRALVSRDLRQREDVKIILEF